MVTNISNRFWHGLQPNGTSMDGSTEMRMQLVFFKIQKYIIIMLNPDGNDFDIRHNQNPLYNGQSIRQ